MRKPPPYFERIRRAAERRWDQLDADEGLAGPWWQLFRQVQSPPHVLSELLQNADDAGATDASATIENKSFVFRHNGKDLTEEDFESLCNFGFSNKRRLLTIGFRGVGFRSTFSLGPSVQVVTPTLAVRFDRKRFTQPVWIKDAATSDQTTIRVEIADAAKLKAIRASIARWKHGALPLVFFRAVQRLQLDGEVLRAERQLDGPCKRSQFVALSGVHDPVLVISSREESFPIACLDEIRDERGTGDLDLLPPCAVTIVWSPELTARLYVVLPTDVMLPLPFSCHGPFLQDPQRSRIKDPSISPTNTWLLRRIGRTLATAMADWVGRTDLGMAERANAYDLLPEPLPETGDSRPEGIAEIILEAFREEVGRRNLVLVQGGRRGRSRTDVAAVPGPVASVWPLRQLSKMLDLGDRKVLAPEVSAPASQRLAAWGLVEPCTNEAILTRLVDDSKDAPPRPERLELLLPLWAHISEHVEDAPWQWSGFWDNAALVPVAGAPALGSASQIFPSRARPAGCSDEDWEFLLSWARIIDPNWIKWLETLDASHSLGKSVTIGDVTLTPDDVSYILRAYIKTGLERGVQMDQVVMHAASRVFKKTPPSAASAIRLTRIAARLDVVLRSGEASPVRLLCRDGHWRLVAEPLLVNDSSVADLGTVLPRSVVEKWAVSEEYTSGLSEPDEAKVRKWLRARNRMSLAAFPLPDFVEKFVSDRRGIDMLCEKRGGRRIQQLPKARTVDGFQLEDFDWPQELWAHWSSGGEGGLWRDLAWAVGASWSEDWEKRLCVRVRQNSTKYSYLVDVGAPRAAWVETLQSKECLPNEFGKLCLPAELYRRTADTLGLLGVDQFVHENWDQPAFHPALDALGVRTQPRGLGSLLERLTALTGTDAPPLPGLRNLYRAVDRVAARLDATEAAIQLAPFRDLPLVFTVAGWRSADFAFRDNPFNLPGVATIHPELQELSTLWERLRIVHQPSLSDALHWLASLPCEEPLEPGVLESVRGLLGRYPVDVWAQTKRWLDSQGELRDVTDFRWYNAEGATIEGLYPHVSRNTADLTFLDSSVLQHLRPMLPPKLGLHLIRVPLEVHGQLAAHDQDQRSLRALGAVLAHLRDTELVDPERLATDRRTGVRLSRTTLFTVDDLHVRLELDATPAGPALPAPVVWAEERLLVRGGPVQAYEALVREVSRAFETDDARAAVRACMGRDPEWIRFYAQAHLGPEAELDVAPFDAASDSGASPEQDDPTLGFDPSPENCRGDTAVETIQEQRTRRSQPLRERVFAHYQRLGFKEISGGILRGPDGEVFRSSDGLSRFELVNSNGEIRPVWIASSVLRSANAIEIPVEMWELAKRTDAVLLEPDGDGFIVHSFADLRQRIELRELEIGPSRFRVRIARREPCGQGNSSHS